jgi:superfamily II DNA or RNA helicase
MESGQPVRIKANPGRIGYITGRSLVRAGKPLIQIRFPDATQYFPENEIELVLERKEHPIDLLEQGRIGRTSDLRRLLTHVKLNGRLANLLYSMEVTNTDFYAYQFKPVLKMLSSVSNGIIIADEVGLGKTIEAGLIWTELRSRFDYSRVMILCPAFLREKWRRELSNRFGIEAEIVDAKQVYKILSSSAANTTKGFAIIGSIQGLRPQKGWDDEDIDSKRASSLLAHHLKKHQHDNPLIDLLVIDEAHYLRISDVKHPDKKTAVLGRLLRDVSEHIVLLSATPIHLRNYDLYSLLNIVDDATFNQPLVFDEILNANAPLLNAREEIIKRPLSVDEFKNLIGKALQNSLLSGNRQLSSLLETPPSELELKDPKFRSEIAYRLESINLLGHVVTRTRKRDVVEWRVLRDAYPEIIPLTRPERLFYEAVTEAVRDFCATHSQSEGFILTTPQRQMSSSMAAALREWKRKSELYSEQLYEDYGQDVEEDAHITKPVLAQLISRVEQFGDFETLRNSDSKYKRLLGILRNYLKDHSSDKIVLFSFFRATLDYLSERLFEDGINNIVLKGNSDIPKDEIIDSFSSSDGPNVLLSSEVGSEGIDLQFSHVLINYDLPWNPMKVEQRIGRIDRLGQRADKVVIWNLFYEDTIDAKIYDRLHKRLKIFEHALGGLEPIIGEQIQKLTLELLLGHLTPDQEVARIEQTAQALATRLQHEEDLEKDAIHLVAYGDYILNQVKAVRELHRWVTGKDIQVYVIDFFRLYYPGCKFSQTSQKVSEFDVTLTNAAKQDLETFIRGQRLGSTTQFVRNDPQPVRCRFENKIISEKSQIEIVNQVHPLVRFVSSRLEAIDEQHYPAVSIALNKKHLNKGSTSGIYVFTIQQWSFDGLQQIEKLSYAAMNYDDQQTLLEEDAERLITAAAVNGEDWLEAVNIIDLKNVTELANNYCLQFSDDQYERFTLQLENQNYDRADIQRKTLELHLDNQIIQQNSIRDKHALLGRYPQVRMTEGKIKALQNRFERKIIEIDQRRQIKKNKNEICVGVIKVY